jgi:cytoskeletal protein RodZ
MMAESVDDFGLNVRAVQLHWVLFLILSVVMAILGLLAVVVRTLANESTTELRLLLGKLG